jgi:glycosyltransferase involved in cell wall biosynthesis
VRVAIDGRTLTGRFTGDRTYWRSLLRVMPRLAPDDTFLVYSRAPIPEGELPDLPNVERRVLEARNERLWTLTALPNAARQDRADLIHVQYTIPPRRLCPCPVITTVHDISFRLYPHWFPLKHRLLMNLTVPPSMRQADRVITDSESSRADILRLYKLPEQKVVAIPLGLPEGFGTDVDPDEARQFVAEKYGLTEPFLLAVGVMQPRKNLRMLARAFGQAKKRFEIPHTLAFVGKAGWRTEENALRDEAEAGGEDIAVLALRFPGYVDDADLPRLYRACAALVHPALYEGFGFPPLEAMACGTPVVVSDRPALPEVVGEAALIVPATDTEAWAEALFRIVDDAALRRELALRGPLRAARFSWETTARRTLEVYRAAIERK